MCSTSIIDYRLKAVWIYQNPDPIRCPSYIIRCWQWSIVFFNGFHCSRAIGISWPNPSSQRLLSSDQFIWPHQNGLATKVHWVRSTVLVIDDVLPLRYAVHWMEQWQTFLLQPSIGCLCLAILEMICGHTGQFKKNKQDKNKNGNQNKNKKNCKKKKKKTKKKKKKKKEKNNNNNNNNKSNICLNQCRLHSTSCTPGTLLVQKILQTLQGAHSICRPTPFQRTFHPSPSTQSATRMPSYRHQQAPSRCHTNPRR